MPTQLIKIGDEKYLKPLLQALFSNQGSSLKDTVVLIASRLNIPTKSVESFIKRLYRKGFLIISRDKYAFTLEGNLYLLNILNENLKDGEQNEK